MGVHFGPRGSGSRRTHLRIAAAGPASCFGSARTANILSRVDGMRSLSQSGGTGDLQSAGMSVRATDADHRGGGWH
jgi:hypothetical protein